jgi:hypothetical protein
MDRCGRNSEAEMRRSVLVMALAALAACRGVTEPRDVVAAYVRIVDQRGDPLRPDLVTWYFDPLSPQFDGEHPAECVNSGCTLWAVPAEASGAAYVAGTWSRPVPGSGGCMYSGYDGKPVAPSTSSPPTVVLRLNTRNEMCP